MSITAAMYAERERVAEWLESEAARVEAVAAGSETITGEMGRLEAAALRLAVGWLRRVEFTVGV